MEDLDYADDVALLSHTHLHIQEKTQHLNTFAKKVGLNTSSKRTEIMALNAINRRPIQIDNEELPCTDRFAYLGNIISRDGGTDLDIQSRLNKPGDSLNTMNKILRSSTYSTRAELRLKCVIPGKYNNVSIQTLTSIGFLLVSFYICLVFNFFLNKM